jgi:hypothetical protein
MSNATHTPGPWHIESMAHVRTTGTKVLYDEGTVGAFFGYGVESAANARLIAAAPDLLAALEFITRSAKMEGPHGICLYAIGDRAMANARAALARAKGQA